MVQRLIRADLCDFDHDGAEEPAVDTIAIEIDGERYETDVCGPHLEAAREQLAVWIETGRRSAARKPQQVIRRTAAQRRAADQIRSWAKDQPEFADIADLGRLPRAAIVAAQAQGIGLELEGAA